MTLPTRKFLDIGAPVPTDETYARHERNLRGNRRFVMAMILARRRKLERFELGTISKPGTDFPHFIAHGDAGHPLLQFRNKQGGRINSVTTGPAA